MGPTLALARFVAQGVFEDLPPSVAHQAKRCLIDWLGVTLGGQREPAAGLLMDYARLVGGASQATVLGRGFRTSLPLAALVNGLAGHVLDFDDTLMSAETSLHGNTPVYAAALAVAEWTRASAAALLNAFVLGFEVAARVALALGLQHYDAGWHATAVAGRFGAAAAAGKLMGLPEAQLATAMGIVGTQAAGNKAVYGTMTKSLHAGRAAHDGVAAALLARAGFTSAQDILEAEHGMLRLYTSEPHPERLLPCPDGAYAVLEDGFKPYPCGSLIHASIDAALEIAAAIPALPLGDAVLSREPALSGLERKEGNGEDVQWVQRIEAKVNTYTANVTTNADPRTGLETKFSAQHAIAAALVRRRAGLDEFSDAAAKDPTIAAMRKRVQLIAVPSCGKEQATLTVHVEDGRTLQAHVQQARGTVGRPLDDKALGEKYRALAEPVLGTRRAARLLALLRRFEEVPLAAELCRLARPAR